MARTALMARSQVSFYQRFGDGYLICDRRKSYLWILKSISAHYIWTISYPDAEKSQVCTFMSIKTYIPKLDHGRLSGVALEPNQSTHKHLVHITRQGTIPNFATV